MKGLLINDDGEAKQGVGADAENVGKIRASPLRFLFA
jgi:hypothetical protein